MVVWVRWPTLGSLLVVKNYHDSSRCTCDETVGNTRRTDVWMKFVLGVAYFDDIVE